MGVKRVYWNLNYSPNTNINDIAIVELERPVNFTYGISAVKLPLDTSELKILEMCVQCEKFYFATSIKWE